MLYNNIILCKRLLKALQSSSFQNFILLFFTSGTIRPYQIWTRSSPINYEIVGKIIMNWDGPFVHTSIESWCWKVSFNISIVVATPLYVVVLCNLLRRISILQHGNIQFPPNCWFWEFHKKNKKNYLFLYNNFIITIVWTWMKSTMFAHTKDILASS